MHIHLDKEKCIGSGQCVLAAPEWFDQDDNGIALVLEGSNSEGAADVVGRAAYTCPARAISVDPD